MQATDDTGVVLDAAFEIEPDGDGLALVMRSASGRSSRYPNGLNPHYNRALELLLGRLRDRGAVLEDGIVDSSRVQHLPEAERRILEAPVVLAELSDIEQFRRKLSRAQGRIGRTSDGNATKQIRLRLRVPGYGADDADRLAADLSQPSAQPASGVELPAANQELADRLHFDLPWLEKTVALLQHRKQIVLYGPPGTGKTHLARELARHITDPDAIRLVQFHPSYTYEDFFEGIRPQLNGTTATFELVHGPLRRLADDAKADKGRPYVLIIDEINRANLPKVFGELYFLLEYRDEAIDLQYSPGDRFSLPANIFVIGTMNTADRSIALVDSAMRRRFAFVELHPDHPPVRDVLSRWAEAHGKDDGREVLLARLNQLIGAEHEFKIGPAYLMKPDADHGLDLVWRHSILPLLEEHFYESMSRQRVHETFGLDAVRNLP
ncbi:McrB family protein [Streptoalloteichus hindustanus]|uniref:5-methylcytosine-specific restriction enzyme B n=1 Tax=Streptoalloteichus hindustanus TaxID=2017 RepID=A0A1M5ICL8_STRHI|nr:AAA family ATPase [Streptoalloteichus hindustanus]SHG26128.1 5-methylcytosine-specific restriction enzyme B [Streptoalloteichus hindustanus]